MEDYATEQQQKKSKYFQNANAENSFQLVLAITENIFDTKTGSNR